MVAELLGPPQSPTVPQPNKQLYENSPLAGSQVEADVKTRSDALYGAKDPNLAILREKPEHRQIVYWKALGFSNREIAAKTGYTEPWISQITRQPWFQKALLDALSEAGPQALGEFMRVQATDSMLKLVNLRDNANSEQVQLAACVNLLDRFLGKPVQRTESKVEVRKTEDRVTDIDKALREIETEERKLLGSGPSIDSGESAGGVMASPPATIDGDATLIGA